MLSDKLHNSQETKLEPGMIPWSISLGRKFLKIMPFTTVIIVLLTLISQVSLVLAFFTPLKVIILLGSESIPSYFPDSLQQYNMQSLIISLSGIALCCYVAHFVSERLIARLIDLNSEKILQKSKKISLYSDQSRIAANAYRRYMLSFSGIFFVIFSTILCALLYPVSVLVLAGYVLVCTLGLFIYHRRNSGVELAWGHFLKSQTALFSAGGFFCIFIFMIHDFLNPPVPGVINAILGLLLTRQIINKILDAMNGVVTLYSQRSQVNSLFFHAQPMEVSDPLHNTQFGSLLEHDFRRESLRELLNDSKLGLEDDVEIKWFQTGFNDVLAFRLESVSGMQKPCLIKIFNHNKHAHFSNEMDILSDSPNGFPALQLIGSGKINGYKAIIFEEPQPYRDANISNIRSIQFQFRKQLLTLDVNPDAADRYLRSRKLFFEYITPDVLTRLELVCNEAQQKASLRDFQQNLKHLSVMLKSLPLRYINPEATVNTLKLAENGTVFCSSWGRWGIEPIAAMWPAEPKKLRILEDYFEELVEKDPAYRVFDSNQLVLSSLIYHFQKAASRGHYANALELLPAINQRFDAYMQVNSKVESHA